MMNIRLIKIIFITIASLQINACYNNEPNLDKDPITEEEKRITDLYLAITYPNDGTTALREAEVTELSMYIKNAIRIAMQPPERPGLSNVAMNPATPIALVRQGFAQRKDNFNFFDSQIYPYNSAENSDDNILNLINLERATDNSSLASDTNILRAITIDESNKLISQTSTVFANEVSSGSRSRSLALPLLINTKKMGNAIRVVESNSDTFINPRRGRVPQDGRTHLSVSNLNSNLDSTWRTSLEGRYIDSKLVDNTFYVHSRFYFPFGRLYKMANRTGLSPQNKLLNEADLEKLDMTQFLPLYEHNGVIDPIADSCFVENNLTSSSALRNVDLITAINAETGAIENSLCFQPIGGEVLFEQNAAYMFVQRNSESTPLHGFDLKRMDYMGYTELSGRIASVDINTFVHIDNGRIWVLLSESEKLKISIIEETGIRGFSSKDIPLSQSEFATLTNIQSVSVMKVEGNAAYLIHNRNLSNDRAGSSSMNPIVKVALNENLEISSVNSIAIPNYSVFTYPLNEKFLLSLGIEGEAESSMVAEIYDLEQSPTKLIDKLNLDSAPATAGKTYESFKSRKEDNSLTKIIFSNEFIPEDFDGVERISLNMIEVLGLNTSEPKFMRVGALDTGISTSKEYKFNTFFGENDVFFGFGNNLWGAEWGKPNTRYGTPLQSPVECDETLANPQFIKLVLSDNPDGANACDANVIAVNAETTAEYILTPEPSTIDTRCDFSLPEDDGLLTIRVELDGFISKTAIREAGLKGFCGTTFKPTRLNLDSQKGCDALIPSMNILVKTPDNVEGACNAHVTARNKETDELISFEMFKFNSFFKHCNFIGGPQSEGDFEIEVKLDGYETAYSDVTTRLSSNGCHIESYGASLNLKKSVILSN